MATTRLSNKGQIVIPKSIRAAHGWEPGVEFSVESTRDSIVLKPVKTFGPTEIHQVIGCVPYAGPKKSLEDMAAAIAKGAQAK
jgi:AbrB family looped-hinge helix DNA binding protein